MSNTYHIVYSAEAIDDLRNIYTYIAYELLVPNTAENQVNRIREKIRSLDFMPEKYARVEWEPWKSRNTHSVPVDHYVIFYTVENESQTVTVIRIFYGGRDIENILQSE